MSISQQIIVLFVMGTLIAGIAIMAAMQNIVNALQSKVLPRLLINGEPVTFTTNVTADDINNNRTAENLQQAIESCDDKDCDNG